MMNSNNIVNSTSAIPVSTMTTSTNSFVVPPTSTVTPHAITVKKAENKFLNKEIKVEQKRAAKQEKIAQKDYAKSQNMMNKAADLAARGKEKRAMKKEERAVKFQAAGQLHQQAAQESLLEASRAATLVAQPARPLGSVTSLSQPSIIAQPGVVVQPALLTQQPTYLNQPTAVPLSFSEKRALRKAQKNNLGAPVMVAPLTTPMSLRTSTGNLNTPMTGNALNLSSGFSQRETVVMPTEIVETVRTDRILEVQPVIHREIDQAVVHHIEQHITEAPAASRGGVMQMAPIIQETVVRREIDEVQPVIHREVANTVVERVEEHSAQRFVAPTQHTKQVVMEAAPFMQKNQQGEVFAAPPAIGRAAF